MNCEICERDPYRCECTVHDHFQYDEIEYLEEKLGWYKNKAAELNVELTALKQKTRDFAFGASTST